MVGIAVQRIVTMIHKKDDFDGKIPPTSRGETETVLLEGVRGRGSQVELECNVLMWLYLDAGPTNQAVRFTPGSGWSGLGPVIGISVTAMGLGAAMILL